MYVDLVTLASWIKMIDPNGWFLMLRSDEFQYFLFGEVLKSAAGPDILTKNWSVHHKFVYNNIFIFNFCWVSHFSPKNWLAASHHWPPRVFCEKICRGSLASHHGAWSRSIWWDDFGDVEIGGVRLMGEKGVEKGWFVWIKGWNLGKWSLS